MRSIRNTQVCVVGGCGFLGSHLVQHLIEDRGCEVTVIDNLCAGRREFLHKDARFFHADITQSEEALKQIFREVKAKYVFNYAAWPYVPACYARPKLVCDVNFLGAIQVINAAQEAGAEAILQVSSAEIYGEGNLLYATVGANAEYLEKGYGKINENVTPRPHSSYGVSKLAVDNYVACAWRERQTPCIALRQFNCVGERETHPYVVPEIVGQITAWFEARHDKKAWNLAKPYIGCGTPVVKLGNNSFRDFLYAGDAVQIAVELLERGQFGECYNLGSESGIKIYDLAKLIGKVMGFADVKVEQDPARVRPWEIWHLQSDNSKIYSAVFEGGKRELDPRFKLFVPLEEALRRTVEWYRQNGCKWGWEV